MEEREVPEGLSPLRYKVDLLLQQYHAESVLQMLVRAIEDIGPAGGLDDADLLPRAGNWCGIYTSLFNPIVQTLDLPTNRRTASKKKNWFSRGSQA